MRDTTLDGATWIVRVRGPVLWAATVAMGLMAGVFFAYCVSVMPALARADDRTFVTTMRDINEAIENPAFGSAFYGAFVLTGAAVVVHHLSGARVLVRWILAALALYVVALAITMGERAVERHAHRSGGCQQCE